MKEFWKRLFSTVILLTLFGLAVSPLKIGFYAFSFLAVFLSIFSIREAADMLGKAELPIYGNMVALFCTLNAAVLLCSQWLAGLVLASLLTFFFCLLEWILLLKSCGDRARLRKVLMSAGVYLIFTIPIMLLVWQYKVYGSWLILFLILGTKIGDTGAYVIGSLSNVILKGKNHKIVPSISPGKSYEGCIGGLICTFVFCWFLWPVCIPSAFSRLLAIPMAVILYIGGASGDLAESSLKRTCGVKDSGHTIPGIGGVLDLVDSLMMNSVLFFLFYNIFMTYFLA